MLEAVERYEAGLRCGHGRLLDSAGSVRPWPVHEWTGDLRPGDDQLLTRCQGPTLDIGCGPGRMAAGLVSRGIPALGIDVSPLAVRSARRRGALALVRDVFAELPGTGRWPHALLADGNIGIGGHPVRLLRRCRELLAPGGFVHLDLEAPGSGVVIQTVRLEVDEQLSPPFRWCWLGVDALLVVAGLADFAVHDLWCADGRWQATLARIEEPPCPG